MKKTIYISRFKHQLLTKKTNHSLRTFKLLSILILTVYVLNACSDTESSSADCSCTEITKKDGLFYRTGLKKEGDRVKFKELFTGVCETKDDQGDVTLRVKYTNGYINNAKEWTRIDGDLEVKKDLTYEKGTTVKFLNGQFDGPTKVIETSMPKTGFIKVFRHDKKSGISYVSDFKSYEDSEVKNSWEIYVSELCKAKVLLRVYKFEEKYQQIGGFQIECLQLFPEGDELKNYLPHVVKLDLPGFWYQGELAELPKEKENKEKQIEQSTTEDKAAEESNKEIEPVEKEKELEQEEVAEAEPKKELYQISDPDGHSNLRETPAGTIMKRVYEEERFEVLGTESKHKKVKLSDGTIGYIHVSRVVKAEKE